MFEIILPYTPAKLNPNRSKTLTSFEYAREFKKYKQQAFFLTKEALGGQARSWLFSAWVFAALSDVLSAW